MTVEAAHTAPGIMGHFMSCESSMREARTNTQAQIGAGSPHEPTGRANARPMTGSATCGSRKPRISLSLIRATVALAAASIVFALGLALSTDAGAQQCNPTGSDQTCTNSIALTGTAVGLQDNGTTLTVTNTNTGTISGVATNTEADGILANADANVTNAGAITATATATGAGSTAFANGININAINGTANVTNAGTITTTVTATGGAGNNATANGINAFTAN